MSYRNRLYGDDMALKDIAEILKKLTQELKEDNDKYLEKTNEPTTILRPSNDGKTSTRNGEQNEL